MKPLRYFKLIVTVFLIVSMLNQICFAENDSKSYSDLLKEAIRKAGMYRSGFKLLSQVPVMGRDWEGTAPPEYIRFVDGLDEKEAVPFLLYVIKNGPDWPTDEFKGYNSRLAPHIARCYAVLCLASTNDSQAYPVLTDLLQNGAYLVDPNIGDEIKKKYDIRKYAAAGLGILADGRAVDLLVTVLDDMNPEVKYQSMFALAKIKDTRAIEPILNASEKYEVDQFSLHSCMKKLTKTKISLAEGFHDKRASISPDFPELGEMKLSEEPYKKIWQHWFKIGKNWTQEKFEEKYGKYTKEKRNHPKHETAIRYERRRIATLGVAALPLIIKKIEQGETDLIPLVSELTDNQINENADVSDVLIWWQTNKNRWTIPFPEPNNVKKSVNSQKIRDD